jgi:hypothetical protein
LQGEIINSRPAALVIGNRVRRGVGVERGDVGHDVRPTGGIAGVRLLAAGVPRTTFLTAAVEILVDDRHTAHPIAGVLEPHPDRVHDRLALTDRRPASREA